MVNNKIGFRKGDKVLIIIGEDKGKKGKIVHIFPKKMEVIVEGVNFLKKHSKPPKRFLKAE